MQIDAPITASMLYDYTRCPTRVGLDLFENSEKRDPISPFVQMLWDRGHLYEDEVISKLKYPHVNFKGLPSKERVKLTTEAMNRKEPLILGGRIQEGSLLGDPDLLRLEKQKYIAGDIKSGAGEENEGDDKKPKKHYAVQLALYTDILEQKGLLADRHAFVWDVHGEEVIYDFAIPMGPKTPETYWEYYQSILEAVRVITQKKALESPAYSSDCKQCHWMTECKKALIDVDDITLIPELGRSRRESLLPFVKTVGDLAVCTEFPAKIPGIGQPTIEKFKRRANLLSSAGKQPYLLSPLELPQPKVEVFFDIETDPLRDVCYLHGFVERVNGDNSTEKYISFFSDTARAEDEKVAFDKAFRYLTGKENSLFYYYSKYERTIWRKLQGRYPDVCSLEQIEALFDPGRGIDLLYDVVMKYTVWPTYSHSIKDLAVYLGFKWRDKHPSGAASIEWFDQWIRTKDPAHKQRILDYNEDDCIATRVLLDAIRQLQVKANT